MWRHNVILSPVPIYAGTSIQFILLTPFMVHEVLNIIYTIYMVHVNSDIDYGGQTFSYILYIKMHNLVRTL